MLLNALDFATAQHALDAADDGDRVYFPGVKLYGAPTGGLQITKSLEIFGDGPGAVGAYTGTVFVAAAADEDVFVIAPPANGTIASLHLHDFKIKTPPTARHGIACELSAGRSVGVLRLERIIVAQVGGDGFHLIGANLGDSTIETLAMIACAAPLGLGRGVQLTNVRSARLVRCGFNGNAIGGLRCESSGVALYNWAGEQNGSDSGAGEEQVKLVGCRVARVDASHFERFTGGPTHTAIRFEDCGGATVIGGSTFGNDDDPPISTGIKVAGVGPVVVLNNALTRVRPTLVDVGSEVSDLVLLPQYNDPLATHGNVPGDVALPAGNGGAIAMPFVVRNTVTPSSAFSGLIIPAGSTEPSTGVQDGMVFYNTNTNSLRVRVGGTWKTVQVV